MEKNEKRAQYLNNFEKLLTEHNQRILFVVTLIAATLSILDALFHLFPLPLSIVIYVCAAISFFPSCALWVRLIRIFIHIFLIPFTERNEIIHLFVKDYKLRTVIMALPGVGITMIFSGYNAFLGISRLSAWYGSLAAYYILMCAMRLLSVLYAKSIYSDKNTAREEREVKAYRNCGIMLFLMGIALMGAVIMLVTGEGGKTYPGLMVYVMAAYICYKFVLSIRHMVKVRKEKSPLLTTLRNIGHCEALVAVLSLQSAMFSAFGNDTGMMIPIMNALTGTVVCMITMGLGISMICNKKNRTGGIKSDSYSGGGG